MGTRKYRKKNKKKRSRKKRGGDDVKTCPKIYINKKTNSPCTKECITESCAMGEKCGERLNKTNFRIYNESDPEWYVNVSNVPVDYTTSNKFTNPFSFKVGDEYDNICKDTKELIAAAKDAIETEASKTEASKTAEASSKTAEPAEPATKTEASKTEASKKEESGNKVLSGISNQSLSEEFNDLPELDSLNTLIKKKNYLADEIIKKNEHSNHCPFHENVEDMKVPSAHEYDGKETNEKSKWRRIFQAAIKKVLIMRKHIRELQEKVNIIENKVKKNSPDAVALKNIKEKSIELISGVEGEKKRSPEYNLKNLVNAWKELGLKMLDLNKKYLYNGGKRSRNKSRKTRRKRKTKRRRKTRRKRKTKRRRRRRR